MSPYVPDPAALRGETLSTLAAAYEQHRAALVNHRHGIGEREPVGRVRATALDALAVAAAATDVLQAERWSNVADALTYGAPVGDVAAAMGLEPVEVVAGLRSWADGQHEHCGMPADERDRVYGLVDGFEVEQLEHERIEHLRGGGSPDPGEPVDEWLAGWVLESRRDEGRR